jgi:hypothetical protein
MPFCPDCRSEYNPGAAECPDCRARLVDALPPERKESDDASLDVKFAPMPELPGRVYAEMVKGALEEHDIPSYIRSDGISEGYGVMGTGPISKGFRLWVPEDKLEECVEIQHQMMDHI